MEFEYLTHTGFQRPIEALMNQSGRDGWNVHTFMPAGMALSEDGKTHKPIFVALMQKVIQVAPKEVPAPERKFIGMK